MILVLTKVVKFILEIIFDIFRFPWWWYSGGLKNVAQWCWRGFGVTRQRVSLGLFVRHFFTPMYGDYSVAGRAISLLMRLVMIVFKLGRLLLSVGWYVLVLLGWVVLLPATCLIIFN